MSDRDDSPARSTRSQYGQTKEQTPPEHKGSKRDSPASSGGGSGGCSDGSRSGSTGGRRKGGGAGAAPRGKSPLSKRPSGGDSGDEPAKKRVAGGQSESRIVPSPSKADKAAQFYALHREEFSELSDGKYNNLEDLDADKTRFCPEGKAPANLTKTLLTKILLQLQMAVDDSEEESEDDKESEDDEGGFGEEEKGGSQGAFMRNHFLQGRGLPAFTHLKDGGRNEADYLAFDYGEYEQNYLLCTTSALTSKVSNAKLELDEAKDKARSASAPTDMLSGLTALEDELGKGVIKDKKANREAYEAAKEVCEKLEPILKNPKSVPSRMVLTALEPMLAGVTKSYKVHTLKKKIELIEEAKLRVDSYKWIQKAPDSKKKDKSPVEAYGARRVRIKGSDTRRLKYFP